MEPCTELTDTDLEEVKQFLAKYVEDHPEFDDQVHVRPNCFCMTKEEFEGEVLELVTSYLTRRNSPSALKSSLAHQVALEILASNLSEYEQEHKTEEDADSQYDAMKVAKGVFRKLSEVCRRWTDELPKLYKNRINYSISYDAIKNTRRKMEDRHVILPDFNALHGVPRTDPGRAFFAVFDGHGGVDGACYASSQLHCTLKRHEKLTEDPLEALKQAFIKTDENFVEKGRREKLRSGSTGVVVLIQGNKLYIGWVGDSQSILIQSGTSTKLMNPHTPDREDERERIEKLGGCVVWFGGWRVNGCLAVSRAIGDYEQKPYVTGEPEVAEYELTGNEDALILACDGLWDTLTHEDAAKLVLSHVKDEASKSTVARALIDEAKHRGSTDNITCIVVFLDGHKRTNAEKITAKETENSMVTDVTKEETKTVNENIENVKAPKVAKENGDTDVQVVEGQVNESSSVGENLPSVDQDKTDRKLATPSVADKKRGSSWRERRVADSEKKQQLTKTLSAPHDSDK